LLGAGSIEELIYARQVYKQQQMRIGYDASIQTRSADSFLIPLPLANPLQTRYFAGVQNDKERQGELFGLQNIFKLHKNTLATKMAVGHIISPLYLVTQKFARQIEEAHLADLDWALANMGGGASKKDVNEIHAAEKKTSGQEGVSCFAKETQLAQTKLCFLRMTLADSGRSYWMKVSPRLVWPRGFH